MRIRNAHDLGHYLRERRQLLGLTQTQVAQTAGVSRRWLSDLERGKATAEIGLVLRTLAALDITFAAEPEDTTIDIDLDEYLNTFRNQP